MPPVVSIVGRSKSGKTTLIERLIPELKRRGYRVATVKHSHQAFEIDQEGKDSWRHAQAGSDAVVISSDKRVALIKDQEREAAIEEITLLIGEGFDIVLVEGFREARIPKIEVHRRELKEGLVCSHGELMAVATDEPVKGKVKQYSLDDVSGLADLIVKQLIKPREEETTLLINGSAVSLNRFTKQMFANTLLGMAGTLKGVGRIKNLVVSVRTKKN